jgi:hypothetical protein
MVFRTAPYLQYLAEMKKVLAALSLDDSANQYKNPGMFSSCKRLRSTTAGTSDVSMANFETATSLLVHNILPKLFDDPI